MSSKERNHISWLRGWFPKGVSTMTQSGNVSLVSPAVLVLLLFFQLSTYVECIAEDTPETVFCDKFVRSKGYLCEEHKMYTEDGFELLLHRVGIPAASGSDNKKGDIQYNLKVALDHRVRKTDKSRPSRLTSEEKLAHSKQDSDTYFTDDFLSESPHAFELTHSDSLSSQLKHRPGRVHWPRSSDARDALENLPLSLPPLTSVANPAGFVDHPHSSSAQPSPDLGSPVSTSLLNGPQEHGLQTWTLGSTILPTTLALNPYTTLGPPPPVIHPIPAENTPGETHSLSPKVSTVLLPPLWYIPGVTQPPIQLDPSNLSDPPRQPHPFTTIRSPNVQSEPSDLPGPRLPAHPFTTILSPNLPRNLMPPETFSPASSRLEIPNQVPEAMHEPQPFLSPVLPVDAIPISVTAPLPVVPVDPTPISMTAPPLPGLPPDSAAFPEPFSPALSVPVPGQLPGLVDESPPYLGPVVPGDLHLVAPPSPSPIESVEIPLAPKGPPSEIVAAPAEEDKRCRPVLLLHHELLNGDMWFTDVSGHGPSPLLPFLLADDGFDVWVGHERATYWAHDHIRLETSDLEYWNWTWDAFVDHDLPVMLDHVNTNTHSKVHVIGVSQSAAVAVAASTQQAVASRIKSLVLIGPSIYYGSTGPKQLQTWTRLFAKLLDRMQPDPSLFSGQFNISRNFGIHNWSLGGPSSLITGPDCCIRTSLTLFDNGWDGTTSYKNFEHFEQGVVTNTFQRLDCGSAARNLEAYGQPTPPAYSPASIPVDLPVQVIYGGNDFFSPPQGVEELFLALQKQPVKVYLRLYAHFDLFYSSRRYQDVYFPILSFLRQSL